MLIPSVRSVKTQGQIVVSAPITGDGTISATTKYYNYELVADKQLSLETKQVIVQHFQKYNLTINFQ
ncbi:hypothetical protein [Psittacicella hinzii]|uniref:Uncharacterized protein n=1 Tax=Psittacicella hinzii TaxID=2028575 RepID=A0A3A1Y9T5_9GAMM|nr:hypothetical protein CKF58_07140 [Psittacicella hinzii]